MGFRVGNRVGNLVGDPGNGMGFIVGFLVGGCVGDLEGAPGGTVGTGVGFSVGVSVGIKVGDRVGPKLGASVGLKVGDRVGPKLGASVGASVGDYSRGMIKKGAKKTMVRGVCHKHKNVQWIIVPMYPLQQKNKFIFSEIISYFPFILNRSKTKADIMRVYSLTNVGASGAGGAFSGVGLCVGLFVGLHVQRFFLCDFPDLLLLDFPVLLFFDVLPRLGLLYFPPLPDFKLLPYLPLFPVVGFLINPCAYVCKVLRGAWKACKANFSLSFSRSSSSE